MNYERLAARSAFGAPIYYAQTVGSTMDEAKRLCEAGEPSGTVIACGEQTQGHGRFGRHWAAAAGQNLLCTIFFRYNNNAPLKALPQALPEALTLRTGLAVSEAVDRFIAPARTKVKWTNDIMAEGKKLAGILTEAQGAPGGAVFIGIGLNVLQREFFDETGATLNNASSLALAAEKAGSLARLTQETRFLLLEAILDELYAELQDAKRAATWRERLVERLFLRGAQVDFAPGGRGTEDIIRAKIQGIGGDGRLILQAADGALSEWTSGEIRL